MLTRSRRAALLFSLAAPLLALASCSGGGSPSGASATTGGTGGGSTSGAGGSGGATSSSSAGGSGGSTTTTTTGGGGGGAPALCGNGVKEQGEECDDGNASGDDGCLPTCTAQVPMTTTLYPPSADDFPNPERGFFSQVDLAQGAPEAADIKAQGLTLAYAPAHLDAYRNKSLDDALLDSLSAGLAAVRAAGIKVTMRFVYNDGFDPDAPKARILEHIQQVKPLLAANADVIAAFQAGFIGAWGEWHSSTNGLSTPQNRKDILLAFLDAVPVSRSVQIRTPMFKDEIFPGGALGSAEAFTGSAKARTGHHNDCFLASVDDMGTYENPIATWKAYVGDEGRYTPVGGETCAVNAPRSNCPTALAELSALHFSFLNALYEPGVLAGWKTQGCMPEIQRRLGYRFTLDAAAWSSKVAPGGALGLWFDVHDDGFAALFNHRALRVVLGKGAARRTALLSKVEPVRWEAGKLVTVKAWLRVPSDMPPGSHRLALWLPDDAPALASRPEYSVRLANPGVWDAAMGENVLTEGVTIDPEAPGAVVAGSAEFVEIQ